MDSKLIDLEQKIQEYNSLLDHLKIGNQYNIIKKEIDEYFEYLENCKKIINIQNINIKDDIDTNIFNLEHNLNRLDEILYILNNENINLNNMLELYTEAYNITDICKLYLSRKKMEIIKTNF